MEVRELDDVVVGDADGADARARQRDRRGAAEATNADEQHARASEHETAPHRGPVRTSVTVTPGKNSSRLK